MKLFLVSLAVSTATVALVAALTLYALAGVARASDAVPTPAPPSRPPVVTAELSAAPRPTIAEPPGVAKGDGKAAAKPGPKCECGPGCQCPDCDCRRGWELNISFSRP